MSKTTSFLSLCLLAILASCNKKSQPAPASFGYNGGYTIELLESWDGKLNFAIKSDKIFDCTNYGVGNTCTAQNAKIELTIAGISAPPTCAGGSKEAADSADAGTLANGTYPLLLTNESQQIIGSLTVTNAKYTVTYPGGNSVTFKNNTQNRVPSNTLWGTIDYADDTYKGIADTFLDSLSYYGAKPFSSPGVTYSTFIAGTNNSYAGQEDGTRSRPYRHFLYDYTGSNDDLTNLVKRYKKYGDKLKIAMTTDYLFFGTGSSW